MRQSSIGVFMVSVIVALSPFSGGCNKETNVSTGNNGGTSGSGGSGGTQPQLPDCSDAGSVPGTAGPEMVSVGRTDGTCFWIDKTEVTRGQYEEFLASGPTVQSTPCSWNSSFDADPDCETKPSVSVEAGHPMVCVDWCDAQAYCQWAGKTLCAGQYTKRADAKTGSWYSACSHGDNSIYPYGKSYDSDVCNGAEKGAGTTTDVAQGTSCVTPEGALGMSGNVYEWTDECKDNTGDGDPCRAYGGSYLKTGGTTLACDSSVEPSRSTVQIDLGFRCCAYAP